MTRISGLLSKRFVLMRQGMFSISAVAILVAGIGGAVAQSAVTNFPQLYLTSDLFPRKGYLEQAFPRQDGLVPLRLCSTSERIYVEQKSLTKLEGRCSEPHPIWRISKFNPDGSVQITDTQTRKAQYVPPQIWAGAVSHLGGDMPAPKVGEFIAGADPNQAGAFYVLKSSPFR